MCIAYNARCRGKYATNNGASFKHDSARIIYRSRPATRARTCDLHY